MRAVIASVVLSLLVVAGAGYAYLTRSTTGTQADATPSVVHASTSAPATDVTVTPAKKLSAYPGMQHYRNAEYGFEFWYPEGWEQTVYAKGRGYYSQFYSIFAPNKAEKGYDPLLINVVVPQFTESSFASLTPTATSIDGVQGLRYEYEFQTEQRMTVIFPLDGYRIIVGTGSKDRYGKEYEQILSTFKFLK